MKLESIDLITFIVFILIVVVISLYASRKEENSEDYFLAGRKLTWWLIGLSIIASNISSEHFIGMSGKGFSLGLAIASFEWMSAFTLIIIAVVFLPTFLRSGIYTMPEYLEYRYNRSVRLLMAIFMLFFYILITLATVLYSGALALHSIFEIDMITGIWAIGLVAGLYTVYGGLKAVVWSDLLQGGTLLIGGLIVTFLALQEVGGWDNFVAVSGDKLHTVLPWDHPEMPWVAVFIGGLWVPHIFYWGLNQFITQRTLGAKDLHEGQKGILFGASLKLLIPFIVVFPGIMAYQLYGDAITDADGAYPYLIKQILPAGMIGIMFAALFGAVMSTLDSLLNSSATIFTMDIYSSYFKKDSSSSHLVKVGRITTLVLVIVGCIWAPIVGSFDKGIYFFVQQFWGFIQPGVVAAFLFGIIWKKVPPKAAFWGMLLNFPIYGLLLWLLPDVAFLHHMAITFILISVFIIFYTFRFPVKDIKQMPERFKVYASVSKTVKIWGFLIFIATLLLYIIFY